MDKKKIAVLVLLIALLAGISSGELSGLTGMGYLVSSLVSGSAAVLTSFGYIELLKRPTVGLTLMLGGQFVLLFSYIIDGTPADEAFSVGIGTLLVLLAGVLIQMIVSDRQLEKLTDVKKLKLTRRLKEAFLLERDEYEFSLTLGIVLASIILTIIGYVGNTVYVDMDAPVKYLFAFATVAEVLQVLANTTGMKFAYKWFTVKTLFELAFVASMAMSGQVESWFILKVASDLLLTATMWVDYRECNFLKKSHTWAV